MDLSGRENIFIIRMWFSWIKTNAMSQAGLYIEWLLLSKKTNSIRK